MTLQAGTRLGVHEIIGALGAGGMGEVYRARDSRLQRDVAIKVLPETLSVDADMLARFSREAQVLAQLNHPNIAAVYGLEEADGVRALVMELVEGSTLADVIDATSATGQGMAVTDVLDIARQIASAMEAAHDQGIIHRDLKPANVKLRPDGTVKVLDFGLAKAFDPVTPGSSAAGFNSPTLSMRATQAGLVLGTAAYMSPEQAKGKPVDRRADIWAFGVVVFEMLCGRSMYTGETVSEILARVIEREPDLSVLPAGTPRRLRDLLRRCLVKDPRSRLRDIGEARVTLEEMGAQPGEASDAAAAPAIDRTPVAIWLRTLPWAMGVGGIALAGFAAWAPWRAVPTAPAPVRVTADLGASAALASLWKPLALSPDGSTVAFIASDDASAPSRIYLRRLDQLEATLLPATAGARSPFFSPDSQWIAFFADEKLKKISVTGGAAVTLCEARSDRGGSWGDDGTIVFAPTNRSGLLRVSAAGGTPEPFSTLDAARGEITHRFPHFVRGADAILYMAHTSGGNFDEATIVVQRLSDGTRQTVRSGGMNPMYLPSGHLAYVHRGTLFAEPFDPKTLKSTGPSVPVLEGIRSSSGTGFSTLTASDSGTLAYVQGSSQGAGYVLQWVAPGGPPKMARTALIDAESVAIAPGGQRVAFEIHDGTQRDIWLYEHARDVLTRLTSDPADEAKPVWTRDGLRVAFSVTATKEAKYGIAWRRADSSGEVQRLIESNGRLYPGSWHPNGRLLAYVDNAGGNNDIRILPIEGNETAGWKTGKPTTFFGTSFGEHEPAFSPDGSWLAYMSNETGRYEVYVRPFPGPGGQVPISTNGGFVPQWDPKGGSLYYLSPDGTPMVVPFSVSGGAFRPEKSRAWADVRVPMRGAFRSYDFHPDGRMMFLQEPEGQNPANGQRATFVFNAFDEFRRKAPVK